MLLQIHTSLSWSDEVPHHLLLYSLNNPPALHSPFKPMSFTELIGDFLVLTIPLVLYFLRSWELFAELSSAAADNIHARECQEYRPLLLV
jgi:hypothetical protein